MPKRAILALACACSTACASAPGDYPSLAIRDAERVSGTLQPAEPHVPPPVPQPVLTDAAGLVAQARAAHDDYRAMLGGVRSTVLAARGADPGSDSWAAASVAVTSLETERSRAMIALAELDRLYVAAATEGSALDELAAAQAEAGAMVAEQSAAIDDLLAVLR
jgi:hypothetical protein